MANRLSDPENENDQASRILLSRAKRLSAIFAYSCEKRLGAFLTTDCTDCTDQACAVWGHAAYKGATRCARSEVWGDGSEGSAVQSLLKTSNPLPITHHPAQSAGLCFLSVFVAKLFGFEAAETAPAA